MSGHIPIALSRGSLDSRREQLDGLQSSDSGQWPRTWQDASSWAAREPRVAGSLQHSFTRTRHPEILDSEQEARSPRTGATPLAWARQSSALGRAAGEESSLRDDLEEPLLFEFEGEEELAAAAAAAAASGSTTAAASAATLAETSSLLSAVPSSPGHLRAVTKDALGTHVQAEQYTMHIEEERATSSSWQAAFNAVNILCGVGLLTTPYAMASSGLSSLLLLISIGGIACYTGRLLAKCMNTSRAVRTYPDIGQAAFGRWGRLLVSVLLYMELFCCCVDFLILEGDNLSAVFPGASVSIGGLHLTAKQSLILAAAIVVLPTVWLRDLSLLSFLSVGGIFASLALLVLVGWEGFAVTGFTHDQPPLVTWSGVPVSIGLFCFCFSGHAVFPSLYASMRTKSHFPWLLLGSFSVVVAIYGTMAVLGAFMFGPDVSENITLDMQDYAPNTMPTVVAMWLVIVNPVAKVALTLAPVAMAMEELVSVKHDSWRFTAASVALRTALLAVCAGVAIVVPFFSLVMSFIGAFMSMSISIVLPCIFYLVVCAKDVTKVDGCWR
ncbi:transmembrane amino acid transporter protein-domain-containing protein [Scenedesmus sp. NREL 46B-D3]|nr:transmembrane amino acid transporter protein-domain-containing protein [Scenedesmus sp. NREL 46B-D3]